MKITAMTGVAMLAGIAAQAADLKVTVCMEAGGFDVEMQAARARDLAAKMYAGIGLTIDWRPGLRGCPPSGILIKVSDYTPPTLRPTSLAYALPFEGTQIVLFYDRIRRYERGVVPVLMAHVLVHEIAHILQGLKRHSDQGIMKAQWDTADLAHMVKKPLSFTVEDIDLIYRGLAGRARAAASPPMQ